MGRCGFRAVAVEKRIWSSAVRAHGGCLGADRRGRTWQAAKSQGEPHAGFDPWMSEWGNPAGRSIRHPLRREPTRGTETSQYLQEEKSNEIPPVAASERGRAQTGLFRGTGVVGPVRGEARAMTGEESKRSGTIRRSR